MRIVDRDTFLALPNGTVFAKYEPVVFGPLAVKRESLRGVDFFYSSITDEVDAGDPFELLERCDHSQKTGENVVMDFNTWGRDGCFNADQLFAVWDCEDVEGLIECLTQSLAQGYRSTTST